MSNPPFFVTHDQDNSARRDARATLIDHINQSNMIVARIGACQTHHYLRLTEEVNRCTECGMQTLKADDPVSDLVVKSVNANTDVANPPSDPKRKD